MPKGVRAELRKVRAQRDTADDLRPGPGSDRLNYALFQDSSRTTNWGNTVGIDTKGGSGNGAAQTFTVYGRLGPAQYVEDGGYADTITATVSY